MIFADIPDLLSACSFLVEDKQGILLVAASGKYSVFKGKILIPRQRDLRDLLLRAEVYGQRGILADRICRQLDPDVLMPSTANSGR